MIGIGSLVYDSNLSEYSERNAASAYLQSLVLIAVHLFLGGEGASTGRKENI